VRLSEIFKWYAADFDGAGGWHRFVSRYSRDPRWRDIDPAAVTVEWEPYDWRVNSLEKAIESGYLERGAIRW
jgi:hypothetical protein